MKTNIKKRDPKTDILRAIAIVCIIVAHSSPNKVIFQLRNFDVILMVLLLGHSFYLSSHNKEINYYAYIKKRFKRLVVPTWGFLSVFFCLFYLIAAGLNEKYYFSYSEIIYSYVLMNGIGFVWIIKVFLIIALISPFIFKISAKIKNNHIYFLLISSGYLFYALLIFACNNLGSFYIYLDNIHKSLDGVVRLLLNEMVMYGMGYGLIAALGIRLAVLNRQEITMACLLFLATFIGLTFLYEFSPTQNFKYPPRLYYISYGLFVSLLLYRLLDIQIIQRLFNNKFVAFISKSSDWVYFWHIIFVYVITLFSEEMPFIAGSFINRFLFIFIFALLVTYGHQTIKIARKKYLIKNQLFTLPESKSLANRDFKTN